MANENETNTEKKALYTISESAKLLSVSEITLYRQISKGKVSAISIGRRKLIPRSFIDAAAAGNLGLVK